MKQQQKAQEEATSLGLTSANQQTNENSSTILVDEPIGESVLRLKGTQDKWFLTIAEFKVTETLKTREEAETEAETPSWKTMINIIGTMIQLNDMHKAKAIGKAMQEMKSIIPKEQEEHPISNQSL